MTREAEVKLQYLKVCGRRGDELDGKVVAPKVTPSRRVHGMLASLTGYLLVNMLQWLSTSVGDLLVSN